MDLSLIAYFTVGLLVVLLVGVYGVATTSLMGLRLQRPEIEPAECSELPEYLLQLSACAGDGLCELGFRPGFCNAVTELVVHALG